MRRWRFCSAPDRPTLVLGAMSVSLRGRNQSRGTRRGGRATTRRARTAAFSNYRKSAPKGASPPPPSVGAIKTGLAELEPSLNPHHFIPIYPSTYLPACPPRLPRPRLGGQRKVNGEATKAGIPTDRPTGRRWDQAELCYYHFLFYFLQHLRRKLLCCL